VNANEEFNSEMNLKEDFSQERDLKLVVELMKMSQPWSQQQTFFGVFLSNPCWV
jgi:hypothetical protein